MNFYEHTIIARQDTPASQVKVLQEKYSKIIEGNEGKILKFESLKCTFERIIKIIKFIKIKIFIVSNKTKLESKIVANSPIKPLLINWFG